MNKVWQTYSAAGGIWIVGLHILCVTIRYFIRADHHHHWMTLNYAHILSLVVTTLKYIFLLNQTTWLFLMYVQFSVPCKKKKKSYLSFISLGNTYSSWWIRFFNIPMCLLKALQVMYLKWEDEVRMSGFKRPNADRYVFSYSSPGGWSVMSTPAAGSPSPVGGEHWSFWAFWNLRYPNWPARCRPNPTSVRTEWEWWHAVNLVSAMRDHIFFFLKKK